VLLIACVVLSLARSVSAQPLSTDVVPDQYELRFTLDFQTDTFTGSEQILVDVAKPTATITLHVVGLTITRVTVVSGSSSQLATVATDEGRQTATLTVGRRLPAGPARLRIEYSGRLQRALRGLYIGGANGRKYAATQFEATDARRAFPCFDQPDLKASFLVTAVVPSGMAAISNGRVLSDTPGPGMDQHTVKFATTRKMSTYLLALAVGDFSCLEGRGDDIPIRVCALSGRQSLGRFALDAAQSFLGFFDGYFAVRFPFGKLDLVAIPDFLGGGMENTGAIFFGEHDLLVDAGTAPVESQKLVATTVAHEMAHQWLGDLVTMKWWNDLWLKEGFATFFETRPVQAWKPEWHVELDEVMSAEEGMVADEAETARPVRTNVATPAEIEALYDPIVYQKAGAVLRMVEAAMGRDAFRAGVNAFLKRYSYSSATAADFWTTMAEHSVSGADRILQTFLEQPGVPLVTVAARCVSEATSSLTLAQQRFRLGTKRAPGASAPWTIPVFTRPIAPQAGVPSQSTNHLLAGTDQTFGLAGCNSLVLANADGAGYFRSAYAPELLARFAKDAEPQLTPAERLRLLNDQWALAQAGRLDVGDYLSLVGGYATERRAQIIGRAGTTLAAIDASLATDANRQAFRAWVRQVFAPLAKELAQPSDGRNELARREAFAKVLMVVGEVGQDADVLSRARQAILDTAGDGARTADPDLADALTKLAAASGDASVFDRIIANIEQAASPAAAGPYVEALGYFSDSALIERALQYVVTSSVDSPAAARVISSALARQAARPTAWRFVKSHWKEIATTLGPTEALQAVMDAAVTFCDTEMRDDLKAFFGARGLGGEVDARLDLVQACIDFRSAQQRNFARWIERVAGDRGP